MRKLIIKVIDHDGSDVDKMYNIEDGDRAYYPNLYEEMESLVETLDTDFDTGKIKHETHITDSERE